MLAVMYDAGKGVPQDLVKAHMWSNLAGSKLEDARKFRDLIAEKLTAQQIAEAQKLARECQARKFKYCD
jgi:TPR repeat protein